MNRRRILSSIHRNVARQTSTAVAPVDHATVARLSIADLDRLGPRLVSTSRPAPSTDETPAEKATR